jgi:hypothetical protein
MPNAHRYFPFTVNIIPPSRFGRNTESIRVQEVLRRLRIYLSELDEFKHFDTALARLAFREKGMRPFHPCRDFTLRHARFFAGRDQLLEKSVIESLMGRSSPLARDSSLRLLLLLHLSSLGNA